MKYTIKNIEETKDTYTIYTSHNFAYDFLLTYKHIDQIKTWNIGSEIRHVGVIASGVTIGCNVFHESSDEPFFCNFT